MRKIIDENNIQKKRTQRKRAVYCKICSLTTEYKYTFTRTVQYISAEETTLTRERSPVLTCGYDTQPTYWRRAPLCFVPHIFLLFVQTFHHLVTWFRWSIHESKWAFGSKNPIVFSKRYTKKLSSSLTVRRMNAFCSKKPANEVKHRALVNIGQSKRVSSVSHSDWIDQFTRELAHSNEKVAHSESFKPVT
jgi:hypothetical protein